MHQNRKNESFQSQNFIQALKKVKKMHTNARFCAYTSSFLKSRGPLCIQTVIYLSLYFNKALYKGDFQAFKKNNKLLITFSSFILLILRKYVTLRLEYLYNNVNTNVI